MIAKTARGKQAEAIIVGHRLCTTLTVIAEVADKLIRTRDPLTPMLKYIHEHARVITLNEPLALSGAFAKWELRQRAKHASLNDGINLATARALHVTLLTADEDFNGVNGAVVV